MSDLVWAGLQRRFSSRGFSLVELLISLMLMGLLASAAMTLYLNTQRHYRVEDQMARIQENGRYAVALLSRELSMAGFFGAALPRGTIPNQSMAADCSEDNWALNDEHALDHVNDYIGSVAPVTSAGVQLDCVEPSAVLPGTDLLVIKRTAAQPSVDRGAVTAHITRSAVESWFLHTIADADPVWHQASTQTLANNQPYDASHAYWRAAAKVMFLRSYAAAPGDNTPSLCAEVLAGERMTARCYVEGVEDMQLEFGIDADGDTVVDQYRANPTAEQLQLSVTVRLHLLMRSVSSVPGYTDVGTYQLGEKVVPPRRDTFLRSVFSATVRLRNMPAGNLVVEA